MEGLTVMLQVLTAQPTQKTQSERSKQLRGLDLSSFLIMPGTITILPIFHIFISFDI
jgi:hypothetical protein